MINTINVSEGTNEAKIEESESDIIKKLDQRDADTEAYKKEMKAKTKEVTTAKENKIKDLILQLNEDGDLKKKDSILSNCQENMADGKSFFNALGWDQERINRKIDELSNGPKGNLSSPYFLGLDDLSEEELQKEYMTYFEPAESQYYLWWVINVVLSSSFNTWFFSAMNWKDLKVDEEFSKIIRITQKLIDISKKSL